MIKKQKTYRATIDLSETGHARYSIALIWRSMVLLLAITSSACTGQAQPSADIVATVNGQRIEEAEMKREMQRCRALVMQDFINAYQVEDLRHFWTRDFDGNNPLAALRQKALDTLVYLKTQEALFKVHGLWPYTDHDALVSDMHDVNAIRQSMVDQGQVIYGPTLFSPITFYDYHFSNAIIKLKAKLKKGQFNVTDSTLHVHLKEMKKTIFANNDEHFEDLRSRIESHYIDQEYERLITESVRQAEVVINRDKLAHINF